MNTPTATPIPSARDRAERLAALLEMGFDSPQEPLCTEETSLGDGRVRVAESVGSMGTVVSVSVVDTSRDRAHETLAAGFAAMDRVVSLLNRFEASSAVSVLNELGHLASAPPELTSLLSRSAGLHRLSEGAFDITVQPLVDLVRERHLAGLEGPPPPEALAEALARIDGRAVRVRGADVALQGEGMGITLDGIAKGYIVDRMAEVLRRAGCDDFLINAGGDIRSRGRRDGTSRWRVAVRDPDGSGYAGVLEPGDGAVATSGSYEIYFDHDQTRHHLVRGDRGDSPLECRSVTVCAPSAMQADGLATAVFVMGPRSGLRLIESLPGCEALLLTREGAWRPSSNWPGEVSAGR